MRYITVHMVNGATTIKVFLIGQTAREFIVMSEGLDGQLKLDRNQWKLQSIEPTYKK